MTSLMLAAAEINPGGLWDRLMAFFTNFDAMFPGFTAVIARARIPFYSIAFVLLVYRLVRALSSPAADPSRNLRTLGQAAVFTGLVAFCVPAVQTMRTAFDSLATQVGYEGSPKVLEEKKEEVLVMLNHDTLEQQKGGTGEQHGSLYYIFHPGEAVQDGADGVVNAFYGAAVQLVMFVCTLLFKLASLIMWAFWLAQQFLLLLNSIFLPAFVAMLAVGGLSGLGSRYVMGLVGVLAWPLGWAFINTGTSAMLESVGETLQNSQGWEVGAYLWAVAICMVIPFWMIIGYVVSPFVIQRMVTSGGNAAQGMFSAITRTAAGAAALTTSAGFSAPGASNLPKSSGQGPDETRGAAGDGNGSGGSGGSPSPKPPQGRAGGGSLSGSYQTSSSQTPKAKAGSSPPAPQAADTVSAAAAQSAAAMAAAAESPQPDQLRPPVHDAAGADVSSQLTNSSRRAWASLQSQPASSASSAAG